MLAHHCCSDVYHAMKRRNVPSTVRPREAHAEHLVPSLDSIGRWVVNSALEKKRRKDQNQWCSHNADSILTDIVNTQEYRTHETRLDEKRLLSVFLDY